MLVFRQTVRVAGGLISDSAWFWQGYRARSRLLQVHRNLLDNLDPKSLQGSDLLGAVGEQADPAQVEIRKNLGSNPDFPLDRLLAFEERRQFAPAMERQRGALAGFLHRKSLRSLVKVNQRTPALLRNAAE